jgi:hypothetical protein
MLLLGLTLQELLQALTQTTHLHGRSLLAHLRHTILLQAHLLAIMRLNHFLEAQVVRQEQQPLVNQAVLE